MMYWRELTVNWGECDPFGLVYFPNMLAWFNDTEHALFREIGYPIDVMIKENRTTFVMGEVSFRFTGPAAYGDRVLNIVKLKKIGGSTLHWETRAVLANDGAPVYVGSGTRVYAHINDDNSLKSAIVPDEMREELNQFDAVATLGALTLDGVLDF